MFGFAIGSQRWGELYSGVVENALPRLARSDQSLVAAARTRTRWVGRLSGIVT